MPRKTCLVTGANRGLGRGLVQALLLSPNTTVIATVRDPSSPSSTSLEASPKGKGSKLIVEKIDARSRTDAVEAVQRLRAHAGIKTLDIVIANSGISSRHGPTHEIPVSEVADHFEVNALGPLLLYQATKPLLEAAESPVFVAISSVVASITNVGDFQLPNTAYATSKAALNFIMRKIHYENSRLIALTLHPGWVQSDMGNAAAARAGLTEAPVTIEASVKGILCQIEQARRTEHGQFLSYDGAEIGW
ncbi:NAD(P)-binding protein [Aspergillus coremiiformis]|uniref:NAD(P)-binding protein n=1 Tax=Aspergillus coremiiformis TaxID=138285 RepID=A0A5N6ZEZ2_9EURO|nr:NAD(P)-binding protein [Aspergillus coremiiformis]